MQNQMPCFSQKIRQHIGFAGRDLEGEENKIVLQNKGQERRSVFTRIREQGNQNHYGVIPSSISRKEELDKYIFFFIY